MKHYGYQTETNKNFLNRKCQKDIAENPLKTQVRRKNPNFPLKKKEKLKMKRKKIVNIPDF